MGWAALFLAWDFVSEASCPDGVPFLAKPWCLLAPPTETLNSLPCTQTSQPLLGKQKQLGSCQPQRNMEMADQSKLK